MRVEIPDCAHVLLPVTSDRAHYFCSLLLACDCIQLLSLEIHEDFERTLCAFRRPYDKVKSSVALNATILMRGLYFWQTRLWYCFVFCNLILYKIMKNAVELLLQMINVNWMLKVMQSLDSAILLTKFNVFSVIMIIMT